ncbi:MAG TPA: M48 family metallopeptidase [Chthoniobacterales bacterium]|jgi:STE24 endopeptidase|nr:M48 family metallopeptidase [Chthoniobacterales bacterium]
MIAGFIIFVLVGYQLLDTIALLLNLRSLKEEVPAEFAGIYNQSEYRRSQQYSRAKAHLEMISSTVMLAALLLFWGLNGFERLDLWLRGLGWNPFWTGILYVAVLAAARELLELPIELYRTFVVETRFGFNRTSWQTFLLDHLKNWAIAGVILFGFLALVLGLLQSFGIQIWPVAWLATAAISILLTYLAPTIILPLFFKFQPLPPGELRDAVTSYCQRLNFPLRDLLVIDGSRRSSKANAFFTGFGKNKRVALYDTLINHHPVPELVAVLAHEVGHYKKQHVLQQFILAQVSLFLAFLLASFCVTWPALFAAFGVTHISYYAGLVLFSLLIQPLGILFGIVTYAWSRHHEYEADRFAAETTGDSSPLEEALIRLSKDTLHNLTPHPLLVGLRFTHPPVSDRVRALRALSIPAPHR